MRIEPITSAVRLRDEFRMEATALATPTFDPANDMISSCSRPPASACWRPHDAWRYASATSRRASTPTRVDSETDARIASNASASLMTTRRPANAIASRTDVDRPASTPNESSPSAMARATRLITTSSAASAAPPANDAAASSATRPRCGLRIARTLVLIRRRSSRSLRRSDTEQRYSRPTRRFRSSRRRNRWSEASSHDGREISCEAGSR